MRLILNEYRLMYYFVLCNTECALISINNRKNILESKSETNVSSEICQVSRNSELPA